MGSSSQLTRFKKSTKGSNDSPPPFNLQLRESFSGSLRKARFQRLFLTLPRLEMLDRNSMSPMYGAFSLTSNSAVHFFDTGQALESERPANFWPGHCEAPQSAHGTDQYSNPA
jgi:hypothetical protein